MRKDTLLSIMNFLFFTILGVANVNALDLTLSNMTDVNASCLYDTTIKTYSCEADNIYIIGPIRLPIDGNSSRNIEFMATNDFIVYEEVKISGNGADGFNGGPGATITISATNLNIAGIVSANGGKGEYKGRPGNGGRILINTSFLNIKGTISANAGLYGWNGGTGGIISINTSSGAINGTMSANGGRVETYAGSGGIISVTANSLSVNGEIIAKGGSWNYGGSGGTIFLNTTYLNIAGAISADGGSSRMYSAKGGTILITSDSLEVGGRVTAESGGEKYISQGGTISIIANSSNISGIISVNRPRTVWGTWRAPGTIFMNINSLNVSGTISANGEYGSEYGSSAGVIDIYSNGLIVSGSIEADGGPGYYRYGGLGGTITMNSSNITIRGSITANGGQNLRIGDSALGGIITINSENIDVIYGQIKANSGTIITNYTGSINPPGEPITRAHYTAVDGSIFFICEHGFCDNDVDGSTNGEDCNDNDASIHPGLPERCDGKDNDCNGLVDDECKIIISSMDDLIAFSTYDETTHTYIVEGGIVLITGTISLPIDGKIPRNIQFNADIFKVNTEASIQANGGFSVRGGGRGGNINISANDTVIMGSVISNGGNSYSNAGAGGSITIHTGTINVVSRGKIEAIGGANRYSAAGGTIDITANTTIIHGSVIADGGGIKYSYGVTGDHHGGVGGNINIKSDDINITGLISAKGGGGPSYLYASGGNGGTIILNASTIDIAGSISANGGFSYYTEGIGGSITTYHCTIIPADEPITQAHHSAKPGGTISFIERCVDSDSDGVYDNLDQCPNTPSGAIVNENGCSDSANQTVGTGGGNVSTDTGSVTMEIPQGALTTNETITINQDESLTNAVNGSIIIQEKLAPGEFQTLSPVYTIEPSGIGFQADVILTVMFNASQAVALKEVELYEYINGSWVPLGGNISVNGDTEYISIDINAIPSDFVILEVYDMDDDGVPDYLDNCPNTEYGDVVNADGCSIAQLCPVDVDYKNHGEYGSCVAKTAEAFLKDGLITEEEKDAIVSAAAK